MKFRGFLTVLLVLIFSLSFLLMINGSRSLEIQSTESNQRLENQIIQPKLQTNPILDFRGLAYGPFRGAGPDNLEMVTDENIEEDMQIFADLNVTDIRTYGIGLGLHQIPQIAHNYGIKCATGTWIDPGNTDNEGEIDSAIAQENYSSMLIIGNEVLTQGRYPVAKMLEFIEYARNNSSPTTPIASAEEWLQFLAYPNLVAELDVLVINVHPVWHEIPLNEAANWTIEKYNEVKTAYSTKTVILGETGWPSGPGGDTFNTTAQEYFYENLLDLLYKENIQAFLFEAFDEQWKQEYFDGQLIGPNWGIMYQSRYGKPAAEVVARYFNGNVTTTPPSSYPPLCTTPADIEVDQGDSASIFWTITDVDSESGNYTLYKNGTVIGVSNLVWQKDVPITVTVDTILPGVFEYKIVFSDGEHSGEDIVLVVVRSTTSSTTPASTPTPGFALILSIIGLFSIIKYKQYKERRRS